MKISQGELQQHATGIAKAMGEGLPPQLRFALIIHDQSTGYSAIAARGTKENAIEVVEQLLAKLKGAK